LESGLAGICRAVNLLNIEIKSTAFLYVFEI
jgi:hypothetical protein